MQFHIGDALVNSIPADEGNHAVIQKEEKMAKCFSCGKGKSVANNVSHANNRTKRQVLPNLQRTRIETNHGVKHEYVCTRCLRSGFVKKAV